jgi:adenosylcobyric acid synthase
VETTITEEKVTEQCTFTFNNKLEGKGYEIHMGETIAEQTSPLCLINGTKEDGYFLNAKTWGSYIHGIFDNKEIINSILAEAGQNIITEMDFQQFKEEQYDKLAKLIRENMDMEYIYKSMEIE